MAELTPVERALHSIQQSLERGPLASEFRPLLGAAAIAAMIWAFVFILGRSQTNTEEPTLGNELLDALAKAHQLSMPEQEALLQLSQSQQLADPVSLFIHPELWPQQTAPNATLEALYAKLFSRTPTASAAGPA